MKHFTIQELCKSTVAEERLIDNTPSDVITDQLTALVDNILDPLRDAYGSPIFVSSGYRSVQLNRVVGGVNSSQHRLGQAADLDQGSKKENKKLFNLVLKLELPFDQLILEYGGEWIHISYSPRNRRQVLKL